MIIKTETPVGMFEVDPSTAKIVHVLEDGYLTTNTIVYWGILHHKDDLGRISQGFTYAVSINPDIVDKVIHVDSLLIDRNKASIFSVSGGHSL